MSTITPMLIKIADVKIITEYRHSTPHTRTHIDKRMSNTFEYHQEHYTSSSHTCTKFSYTFILWPVGCVIWQFQTRLLENTAPIVVIFVIKLNMIWCATDNSATFFFFISDCRWPLRFSFASNFHPATLDQHSKSNIGCRVKTYQIIHKQKKNHPSSTTWIAEEK